MSVRILVGDCIARLRELPADSVHCAVTSVPYWGLRAYLVDDHPDRPLEIGREPTPEAWAAKLVEVFREVRRVLRPDGCCWINCGDSYAQQTLRSRTPGNGTMVRPEYIDNSFSTCVSGLKPKDLIGQPWLLAFALRADGWWLRSEIIWAKPNPMPESVLDRPTKAHEQVFLLTKAERYFYDAEAVREGVTGNAHSRGNGINPKCLENEPGEGVKQNKSFSGAINELVSSRNARSVWTIATEPYAEAHFATFPTELARRCILAGTSAKGCCPQCGAPWARVVETVGYDRQRWAPGEDQYHTKAKGKHGATSAFTTGDVAVKETTGWRPSCACDAGEPIPCTVLDPFGGSGTTGLVAEQLGRDAVLIELSPDYAAMAERRIAAARSRRMLGDVERVKPMPGQASLF